MALPVVAAGLLKVLGGTAVRAGLGSALRAGAGRAAVRLGGTVARESAKPIATRLAGEGARGGAERLVRGGVYAAGRRGLSRGKTGGFRAASSTVGQALLGMAPGNGRVLNAANLAVWAPLMGLEAVDLLRGNEEVSQTPTQALERVVAQTHYNQMQAARLGVIRKKMMEATVRLAQADPQLYQEVVMGQRLPRGARVFGQSTRPELMTLLASDMAQGRIESVDPEQQLAQLIGGM